MRRLALVIALLAAPAAALAEPPKTHEIIYTKPSGFWTSNRPAEPGHEYRWRLLGIGCVLSAAAAYLCVRLARKANAERAARIAAEGSVVVDAAVADGSTVVEAAVVGTPGSDL